MHVYILRHAWAGHFGDPAWPDDTQRPLSDEGRARFARVARLLAERGCRPEVIATSPLVRCRQTAEILASAAGGPPIEVLDDLEPGARVKPLLKWTAAQDAQVVAWVGHAPDVSYLTAELIGPSEANVRFAKGACAAIRFDGPPRVGTGELVWHATAKLLGC